ncbi:hypothetical protein SG34_018510 [Thalassomonas viridans]|uniref:Uncharacterized protein n=1 Tax=Thalassomonas viridans TaxID=137584 RepID=A0AAE9YZE0_9GAMM|nr:hypothetical protein [Thalassomonas viridans]WDE03382.1 hypothetical protein SG34_018510 [Thalassomonas viridans]
MIPSVLEKLIKSSTHDGKVNLKEITEFFNIKIELDRQLTDLCQITLSEEDKKPVIKLSPNNDRRTKFTLVAIAIAEFILTPSRLEGEGIRYDMFFLKEIYHQRYSYRMMLATRLAVPEEIINRMDDPNFDMAAYLAGSDYQPQFINCCVKDSSALFLLSNFSDLPANAR